MDEFVGVILRGGQKNRTEPSQTEPTEPKPIRTEPKSISNHLVDDFLNPNGSVRFGSPEPNQTTDVFLLLFKLKILVIPIY